MISIQSSEQQQQDSNKDSPSVVQDGSTPMEQEESTPTAAEEKKEDSESSTTVALPTLEGLSKGDRTELLRACVALVSVPVDPDALNAVLRLCLRLTQVMKTRVLARW